MNFWFFIIFLIIVMLQCFNSQSILYNKTHLFLYLKHFCNSQSNLRYNLFLIENASKNAAIKSYLSKKHCDFLGFKKSLLYLSINNLKTLIEHQFKYTKLQLIFIFSSYQVTQNFYDSILLNQSSLYSNCDHCFPIINIFCISKQTSFYNLTLNIFSQLPNNFQTVVLSFDNNVQKQSIFTRPVFDNCHLYNGLFVPTSQNDFNRLNIDLRKCNLSGQTVNVSVNNVQIFFSKL